MELARQRSETKAEALERAIQMAREGKDRGEIVAFLTSTYLYAHPTAYTLANAALYRVEKGETRKIPKSMGEIDEEERKLRKGWGDVKEVDESRGEVEA